MDPPKIQKILRIWATVELSEKIVNYRYSC